MVDISVDDDDDDDRVENATRRKPLGVYILLEIVGGIVLIAVIAAAVGLYTSRRRKSEKWNLCSHPDNAATNKDADFTDIKPTGV